MNKIRQRIELLRAQMKTTDIQAYFISGTDPHQSEYAPGYWQSRTFISGFTGSAGMVLVTLEEAALWTDSRYFLQAENELHETGIQLMKQRVEGTPSLAEWLGLKLKAGDKFGLDAACVSINQFNELKEELAAFLIEVCPVGDLLEVVWEDRPALPTNLIFEHEIRFAGKSRQQKLEQIRIRMAENNSDYLLISALDELAWIFNLRGSDVDYNPVFVAYALIGMNEAHLFMDDLKLAADLKIKLENDGITILPYQEINSLLNNIEKEFQIGIDPAKINQQLLGCFPAEVKPFYQLSIPTKLKSEKTAFEVENIRNVMRKDGVAMVEFLFWLNKTVGNTDITELDVAHKLPEIRSRQEHFVGESFYPIVGYREHGAVVHYDVSEKSAKAIHPDGFLLIDSGGQYLDGTTDITRTLALSEPSLDEKRDFTLVLKGMIALSMAVFPEGTKGCNLDILARKSLWEHGLNYGHGTGHGVGYFLNVHEGPMGIRQEFNEHAIKPGNVLSNEPGFYREGEYGIRTENMIVCVEKNDQGFGKFFAFETLTLCPIDLTAIDTRYMDKNEIRWLNDYHQRVFDELAPFLDDEKVEFLQTITSPII